jgi:hypothetical protein
MQWFYDGQIRRYVGQIVRMLSGFRYQSLDGKQTTVPVMYGDLTRQVSNIIRENSENKIPSAPRIAVYISDLAMDKTRLADSTHVSKIHIREREKVFDSAGNFVEYGVTQGSGYTVERLMPTPYKLTVKADIWSTNTDQKLQILEQILMLFNPSLELQTSDNYIDWTSISVLEITNIQFSTKNIPVGVDSDIEIASITFETPIYISPPTKVKRLGVIHDIIMNIHDQNYDIDVTEKINIGGFDIFVYYNTATGQYNAELLDPKTALSTLNEDAVTAWQKNGADLNWRILLDQYAGKFRAGSTQIFLEQATGNYIVGTVAFIDPETYNPGAVTGNPRYLILNNIGNNTSAWGNIIAKANDIIEWTGTQWVVAQASEEIDEIIYTTNLRTGVQYKFEDGEWTRAFEGEYQKGSWRIVL